MKQTLPSLRKEIDKIDNKLINLIAQRMKLAKKIAKIKKTNKLKLSYPKREQKILKKLKKQAKKKNINEKLIKLIFKNIIKNSKEIQKKEMKK